jgi:uncharacterized membrane protein (DUF485 family)
MIGKPEWFKYRTFGWGVAPKTWQGWVYVAALVLLVVFITSTGINAAIKPWILGAVLFIVIADVAHIMSKLPKVHDERENLHQLIIERNCSFAAIAALVAVALYQTYQNRTLFQSGLNTAIPFDISIAIVLGAMLVTKVVTTLYVRKKL